MQYQLADINLGILAVYCVCFLINKSASRAYALLAFFVCCLISYTELYNLIDAIQYHALFAIIYTLVTYKVRGIYTKIACCLIGCFQILMAWDGWANAKVETYIWLHYESFIYALHCLIITSFISRDIIKIKLSLGNFFANMFDLFRHTCNMSCLCYYYAYNRITKEHC